MGAAALLLLHTLMRGSRGIPLPSLGTLGPGLMTPPPTRRGALAEKGEGDPAPSSVSASVPRFCPARTRRSRLGWGREGGAGVGRGEAGGGNASPGRPAGGRAPDICQGVGAAVCASQPDDKVHNSEEKGHTRGRGN